MPCQWSETVPCPFTAASDVLTEYEGRQYCPWHLPLRSNQKEDASKFAERFHGLQERGHTQFSGITFPGTIMPNRARYDARRNLDLRQCTFGDRAEIASNAVDLDVSRSSCIGACWINVGLGGNETTCRAMTFHGHLTVDATDQAGTLDFEGSAFHSTSQFNSVERMRSLSFANCDFTRPPVFTGNKELPQKTNFRRATFALQAEDESVYRVIRNFFNAHRARDTEGRFYALEKRCHRLGLRRSPEWTPRAVSFLYDLTSEYGYSYGRALLWFCMVQVGFGITYAALSGRLSNLRGDYDSQVAAFTFAQIVKPFELFTSKAPGAGAYAIISDPVTGWWLLLTAVQSVVSITLIALFLLAIRWRFRRE